MKVYRVTVEGKQYDVTVEELSATQEVYTQSAPVPAPTPVSKPAPVPAPAAAPKPAAQPSTSGNTYALKAPMPGVVLDIKVSVGASVTKNQIGVILEAMKMENEICIPVAGKVASISVTKGATINAGDLIMNIEQ